MSRKKIFSICLLIFLAFLVLKSFVLVLRIKGELSREKERLEKYAAELAKLRMIAGKESRSQVSPVVEEFLEKVENFEKELAARMISSEEKGSFVKELQSRLSFCGGKETGLAVYGLKNAGKLNLKVFEIALEFESNYRALRHFIHEIERNYESARITGLEIDGLGEERLPYRVRMKVECFTR